MPTTVPNKPRSGAKTAIKGEDGKTRAEPAQFASRLHEGDVLEVGFVVGLRCQERPQDGSQGSQIERSMLNWL